MTHVTRRLSTLASLVIALGAITSLAAPSRASALDCGERVIATGDPIAYVRAFCGEPISVVSGTVTRSSAAFGRGGAAGTTVSLPSEVWVYDFGPDRLMVELTFQRGRLVFEQTLGRGTAIGHPPDGYANGYPYLTHADSRAYRHH